MAHTEYNTIFHAYLLRGLAQMTARVQAADPLPDERDREQAWHILSYAFRFAEAWPYTRELLLTLAPKMEQAGFREDWLAYLQEGYRQAQAQQDELTAAECELQIGLLYRLLSRFAEAQQWTSASIEHFVALGKVQAQARALNELAWQEHLKHQYDQALQHVEQALVLTEDCYPERAMSYRIKGMIAIGQMHWSEAEQYHSLALALFQQNGDLRKMAWSRQNLGYALKEQGKFDEALECYQQASSALKELKDIHNLAIVQMNIGNVFVCLKRSDEALAPYSAAQKTLENFNDLLNLGRLHTCFGLAYLDLAWYIQAQQAFMNAANLYEILKDAIWKLNALDGLAIVYIATKQYSQAIDVLERAIDSMVGLESNPYYHKLFNELTEHLEQARQGQRLLIQ